MRFITLVLTNIKTTLRNKQALFWHLVFPILMMTIFGIVFAEDQNEAKISLVDLDKTSMARSITKALEGMDKLVIEKDNRDEGLQKLKEGKVGAVVVLEKGFSGNFPQHPADIKLYHDPASSYSQMIRGTVGAVLGGIERSMVKAPPLISVEMISMQSEGLSYIDFLLPGILAMAIMQSGVFGIASAIVTQREKGILRRLKLTPMPLSQFIGAGIIDQLIMALVQAALLIGIGHFVFGVKIVGGVLPLAAIVIVGSLCFITLGFVIASFAKTVESASAIGNLIGMPMMFLGGVFFPVENVPAWIKPIIKVLPLKYLADALRDIALRGQELVAVKNSLLILLASTLVFFVLSVAFFKWESDKK